MTSADPLRRRQIQELYLEIRDLEPDRRESFLERRCAGDEVLRKEVERLLADEGRIDRFLETPALMVVAEALPQDRGAEPAQDLAGRTLKHYRLVQRIRSGGQGQVYLARDAHLPRDVAVKILLPGTFDDEEARSRFRKEARALALLRHDNIETIHDFDTQDGIDFLVAEYVPGLTLRDHLSGRVLAEDEIVSLGEQLVKGVWAAHQEGIVHRDLKPANLMVEPSGRLKILDFGLAKRVRKAGSEVSTESSTMTHAIAGTLPYMSPEQLSGKPVDARTDIYAVGNVLYEMAAGRPPFRASLPTALIDDIIHKPPPPPGRFRPDLSAGLEGIILKCLEKNPELRYQSANELHVDLLRRQRPPVRLQRPWLKYAAAALLVVFFVLVVWLPTDSTRSIPPYDSKRIVGNPCWVGQPAISPDGNRIVYTSSESGNLDIYWTELDGNGTSYRLTDDPADDYDPAWYPDGSAIAFASERGGKTDIWKIGLTGGNPSLLIDNGTHPAISTNRKIAFSRTINPSVQQVLTADLENPSEGMPLPGPENSSSYDPGPCWSPDGRAVCFAGQRNLYVIPLSGGKARKITKDDKGDFDPSWSPDGRHIYFSSYRGNKLGAWRVGVDGGIPEAVTPGTGQEEHPSLSRDGTRLVLAGNITSRELRLIDLGSTKWRPLPVDGEMAVLAPDRSKIAYVWASPGSIGNLWILPLVTASPAPYHLSDDTSDASVPAFSPDGKFIAYSRNKPSPFDIWITPTSGGRAVRFTEHSSRNIHPSWSPDGDSIAFSSDRSGKAQIWIAPVKAGRPTGKARMLASGCAAYGPAWSPDGSRIAFLGVQDDQNELWLAAADGSVPAYQVTTGAAVSQARWVWRTDELVVSGKWGRSSASLRRVNPETGAAQPFRPPMDFGEHEEHGQFDISRDGTLLLALYKSTQGEIWVLQAKKRAF